MRRRNTIAGHLALIGLCGVAVAALRYADDLVASLVFTGTLLAFGVASLGAAFRRGLSRASYAGFAAFGFGYLALCYGPFAADAVRPNLATTKLLDFVGPRINQQAGDADQVVLDPFDALDMLPLSRQTAPGRSSSRVVSSGTPFTLTLAPSASAEFMRVGHSLFSLLIGLLGGLVARHFAARGERERSSFASPIA